MRMFRLFLTLPIILAACLKDETVSGYADPEAVYHLQEIDGVSFAASATIAFPEKGTITGKGPCNRYSASQNAPYPWMEIGPIAATRASCQDLSQEILFFKALSKMTLIETLGDTVILRDGGSREMVFVAR